MFDRVLNTPQNSTNVHGPHHGSKQKEALNLRKIEILIPLNWLIITIIPQSHQ